MKATWFSTLMVVALLAVALVPVAGASPAVLQDSSLVPDKIVVNKFGTTSVSSASGPVGDGSLGPIATEIQKPKRLGSSPLRTIPGVGDAVALTPGTGSPASSNKKAKSNPEVNLSFEGLNPRNSRLAFGGNQFSGEPADQGLCVGNGVVLETVNSALRVYNANSGPTVSPGLSLNELYGFPPAINRTTGMARR